MSNYTSAQRRGESWAQPHPQYVAPACDYHANIYYDNETGRERWAVLHKPTRTWYFPKRYGMAEAARMARRLNNEVAA